MKKLLLVLALLVASTLPHNAHALEIKFGLLELGSPLYEGAYTDPDVYSEPIDDSGLVGRIEIGHQFRFTRNFGINIFATHMSMFQERDPHYGVNGIGAEFVFTLY